MDQNKIETVADALADAWRERRSLPLPADDLLPVDMKEAFAIQDALDERLDYPVVGWKLGITSRAGKRAAGIDHPMLGRLYGDFVKTHPARFRFADFCNPNFEAELTFRLGRDLPARDEPYREAEVRDAVAEIIMAIDVSDTRWEGSPSPVVVTADNGGMGAFVVGDVLPGWQSLELATLPINSYVDDKIAGPSKEGDQRSTADELIDALCWAANELSRRGLSFRAGDVVATGATTEPAPAVPGAELAARFGDLGEVKVTLEA